MNTPPKVVHLTFNILIKLLDRKSHIQYACMYLVIENEVHCKNNNNKKNVANTTFMATNAALYYYL